MADSPARAPARHQAGRLRQPAHLHSRTTTAIHESGQKQTEISIRAACACPQRRLLPMLCRAAALDAAAAVAAAAVDAVAEEVVVARTMRWVAPTQRLAPLSGSRVT